MLVQEQEHAKSTFIKTVQRGWSNVNAVIISYGLEVITSFHLSGLAIVTSRKRPV